MERSPRDRGRELYNVASNPTEEGNNLIVHEPDIAVTLEKQILAYLEAVDPEKPKVNLKNKKKQKSRVIQQGLVRSLTLLNLRD